MQVCKPCYYALIEAVEPFKLHPMSMAIYMRGLSTFSGYGCAYGFIFTSLPPQTLPQICESWLKSYLMQVCKPCHYTSVEVVQLFKLHSTSMWYTCKRGLSTFSGCGCAYGFTLTSLPPQTLPQIWESWLESYLMQVCKPCHLVLVEDLEPFKLHPMSMSYTYEVFEHILRLWMGIWLHIHIVTTSDTSPDLWQLAEILPNASVQTMPLCFGWGCRTFQTESHKHVIHIWGVWGPSHIVDGHMDSHSLRYKVPRMLPQIWRGRLKSYLMQVCKPCHYALIEAVEPFKLHPMSMAIYVRGLSAFSGWGWHRLHIHIITTTDTSPDLWELAEILPDASVQTMPLRFCWGFRTIQTASQFHVIHI